MERWLVTSLAVMPESEGGEREAVEAAIRSAMANRSNLPQEGLPQVT